MRREYLIQLTINGRRITEVIIDPHYEVRHSAYLNDQTIIRLVYQLDGFFYEPEDVDALYLYFATDNMMIDGRRYKLVWLLEDGKSYIGVINAYRR